MLKTFANGFGMIGLGSLLRKMRSPAAQSITG
jgi:hypothetical protein